MQLEQNVRASLGDLREALQSVDFGAEGEAMLGELVALEASDDPPASFLERARRLTNRVVAVAKNVGDTATPVLAVLRVLGPLVGVPIP